MRALPRGAAWAAAMTLAGGTAWAQAPDAGRLLQEGTPPPPVPRPAPPLNLQAPPSAAIPSMAGGVAVVVQSLRIEGLSVIDPASLGAELADVTGRRMNLAAMREFALEVETRVRARGYPFARAYVPPQDLAGGVLRIAVVEGRYGQVRVVGDATAAAQPWLDALRPGQPITLAPLERSLLLVQDLPGVQAQSRLRPGADPGTGDLEVRIDARRRVNTEVGADNHGNRYSGRARAYAAVEVESPFGFGDQFNARASTSEQGTWLAAVAYSLPIGSAGWRAQFSVARTDYDLGKEFASLGAQGTADIASAALSYPIVRTQGATLRGGLGLQARRLLDVRNATATSERKQVRGLPLSLSGDLRQDQAITWGSLVLGLGGLDLDAAASAADQGTARSEGGFAKITADLSRLQAAGARWTFYGRLSAQWANRNLDSSEKFILGGPYAVRGWPTGEAGGDSGWLAQIEARWRLGGLEPYGFIDAGGVRINRRPWTAGINRRQLEGAGIGVRWASGGWSADLAAAWRLGDKTPLSEPAADRLRLWATARYRF